MSIMSLLAASGGRRRIAITISADTQNYNLYTNRGATYLAGQSDIVLTINSGVTVGSALNTTYALTVGSSFDADDTVTIINNGTIVGAGGAGGKGANATSSPTNAVAGLAGGPALLINRPTSVNNLGTIASGGGGGGGGSGRYYTVVKSIAYQSGSGGGGGAGSLVGAAGAAGSSNGVGNVGVAGTATAGGAGGVAKNSAGAGGAGGARGAAGTSGTTGATSIRGTAAAGGTIGNYITGNASVTWIANGTRLGGVA